jgi:hypothetical protein
MMSGGAKPVVIHSMSVPVDGTLEADHGWHDLQVRWLVSDRTMDAETTVVGMSVFPARRQARSAPSATCRGVGAAGYELPADDDLRVGAWPEEAA